MTHYELFTASITTYNTVILEKLLIYHVLCKFGMLRSEKATFDSQPPPESSEAEAEAGAMVGTKSLDSDVKTRGKLSWP